MKKVLISVLLVLLTLCLFVGCSDSPQVSNPEPINESLYTMKKGTEWFSTLVGSSGINTNQITKIHFVKPEDYTSTGKTIKVDGIPLVNEGKSENIKGYVVKLTDTPTETYEIYIVGDYIFGNSDCSCMFNNFHGLTSIDFDSFDTSSVTCMSKMFQECSSLTDLDLSGFDTSNVEKMNSMFNNCSSLITLDLSSFDITPTTDKPFVDTSGMFGNVGTSQTTTIYVSEPSDWRLFNGDKRTFTTKP